MESQLNSLRAKTLAVICVLVAAPVLFVWLTSPFESATARTLRQTLAVAQEQATDAVRVDAPPADVEEVARRLGVWVRVVDVGEDELLHDFDGTQPTLREKLAFAPDDVPSIRTWDETQIGLLDRREVAVAREHGRSVGCRSLPNAQMVTCWDVTSLHPPGKPALLVHLSLSYATELVGVASGSTRIVELMLCVTLLALVLGVWLASRITFPLQRLRDQVLERTKPPVSTRPIEPGDDADFAEVADAVNELLGALDERRRSNERFMADMAHEIKNPVAAIRAAAESLARGKDVPAKRAERLSNILSDSARRLDGVVTNFLELARAESGLPRVDRELLDLDELVSNSMQTYSRDDRYDAIDIDVECDDHARVLGSPEHLERALRNLVENALSFAANRVHVRVHCRNDSVILSVRDDGKGILPEDVERVFDRFFTRRDDGGGTGLGLAMTQAICDAHGGSIEVDSSVGVGTEFIITLPRAPATRSPEI